MRRLLKRFGEDRRGIAALEFALIAPVLVTLYFGMAELTGGLMATRKVSTVASSIGDLTTQSSTVTPSQLTDIFNIGTVLMQPYPVAGGLLNMRLSSVTVDATNTPHVDWSEGYGNMAALAKGAVVALPLAAKAKPTDPDVPFITQGQSVIMAEAHYAFASPVAQYLPATSDLHDTLYLFPRQGGQVTCPTC